MSDTNINGGFGVNVLYVCDSCTVVRYGKAEMECPACGESGVHRLLLEEPPEFTQDMKTDGDG